MATKIKYGSEIYLRHVSTGTLLKSLPKAYCHPNSSGQQMVVASLQKTDANRWLVKAQHSRGNEYAIGDEVGDKHIIRLEHCSTKRNLHSHGDRHAPVTIGQQEVTCYSGLNAMGDENDNWVVQIADGGSWCFDQNIKLVHLTTSKTLHSHGISHPVFTDGEQEVTGYAGRDDNDLWVIASADQPPLHQRIKFPTVSKTWLDLLNIAGSIASITGWTLLTLSKTLQATTFIDLISYLISSTLLLGLFMIFLSIVWKWHIRMTANPQTIFMRAGLWLTTGSVIFLAFVALWRLVTVLNNFGISPVIKWALKG
jgi:hypothetical protein